ncbi:MAG: hypothetical protein L6Q97_15125, partial [Thermoanaerobaculia bacterium]|nr:hypothetical protein [Thermoanaerobaculia bacterium]
MAIRVLAICWFGLVCLGYPLAAQNPLSQVVDFTCSYCLPADALVQLSRQTRVNIVFNDQFFQHCPPVSISARRRSLASVLDEISACAPVSYRLQ